MLAPMMPHLAEEIWTRLGNSSMICAEPWPQYRAELVADDEVTLPVQINGKRRGEITVAKSADNSAIEELVMTLDFVQNNLQGNTPKKIIVVPNRIVNIVA